MTPEALEQVRRALAADPALAAALRASLAPLVAYDREHGGDLVRTLAVTLRAGGNHSRAAAALFLHRNSLYYRLAHIQALTGCDLDDPAQRLWLQLALLLITPPEEDSP